MRIITVRVKGVIDVIISQCYVLGSIVMNIDCNENHNCSGEEYSGSNHFTVRVHASIVANTHPKKAQPHFLKRRSI